MPTIADLRRYEDEGVVPETPTAAPTVTPATQATVRGVVTPPAPQLNQSADNIWQQWFNIRQDAQPEPVSGWWESPEEYPQEVIQRAATPRISSPADMFTSQFDYAPAPGTPLAKAILEQQQKDTRTGVYGYEQPAYEQKPVLKAIGDWFNRIGTTINETMTEIAGEDAGSVQSDLRVANALVGWPWGKPDRQQGKFWWLLSDVVTKPAKYAERAIGFGRELYDVQRSNDAPGVFGLLMDSESFRLGTFASDFAETKYAADIPDELLEREIAEAEARQQEYDAAYKRYREQGSSEVIARAKAFNDVLTVLPKLMVSTDEGLVLSEEVHKAYQNSAGFAYTWEFDDDRYNAYLDSLDAGMSPDEAKARNQNDVIENWGQFILDPLWVIPLDNAIIGAGLDALKTVGRGTRKVLSKVPIIDRGLNWLAAGTAGTAANKAANYAKTALHEISSYASERGLTVDPELITRILADPPEEILGKSRQVANAFAKLSDSADNIAKAVTKAFESGMSDDALGLIRRELGRGTLEVTDEMVEIVARRRAFVDAVSKGSLAAYADAIDNFVSLEPKLDAFLKRLDPINKLFRGPKGILVDLWLGTRPAWNVFNYADNFIKLMLDGSNPMASIPRMATNYAQYAPEMNYAVQAIAELKKIPFWKFGAENNRRYVELLYSLLPPGAIGGFAQHVTTEAKPSILRRLPGTKQLIEWNTSLAERIEATMRTRIYFKHFGDAIEAGRNAIVTRTAQVVIDNVVRTLPPAQATMVQQRLSRLGNPTVADVQRVFNELTEANKRVVVSTIGEAFGDGLNNLPRPMVSRIQAGLGSLVEAASTSGSGKVSVSDLNKLFSGVADDILQHADEMEAAARAALNESLPTFARRMDDILDEAYFAEGDTRKSIGAQPYVSVLGPNGVSQDYTKLRGMGYTDAQISQFGGDDVDIIIRQNIRPPASKVHRFGSREEGIQHILDSLRGPWKSATRQATREAANPMFQQSVKSGKIFASDVELAEYIYDTVPMVYVDDLMKLGVGKTTGDLGWFSPDSNELMAIPHSQIFIHEFTHKMEDFVTNKLGRSAADSAFNPIKDATMRFVPPLDAADAVLNARPQWWYPTQTYQQMGQLSGDAALAMEAARGEAMAEAIAEYTVRPKWLAREYKDIYDAINEGIRTLPKEYWFKNMLGNEFPPVPAVDAVVQKILPDAIDSTIDDTFRAWSRLNDTTSRVMLDAQETNAKFWASLDADEAAQTSNVIRGQRIDEFMLEGGPRHAYYQEWLDTQEAAVNQFVEVTNNNLLLDAGYLPGAGGVSPIQLQQAVDSSLGGLKGVTFESVAESGDPAFVYLGEEFGGSADIAEALRELGWYDYGREAFESLSVSQNDIAHILYNNIRAPKLSPDVSIETFPQELVDAYLAPGRNLEVAELNKWKEWKHFYAQDRAGVRGLPTYKEMQEKLSREFVDAQLQAQADMHDALTNITRWYMDHGITDVDGIPLTQLGLSDMWWRVAEEVNRIPTDSLNAIRPLIDDLNSWYDEAFSNRMNPFTDSGTMTTEELDVLRAYGERTAEDTFTLVSDATDQAVKAVNDTLFDYETTQNWMQAAGNLFPFVRFPSRNIPFWLNKFAEVPHLSGSVVRALQIQEAYNKDLPPRLRRTVKLPSAVFDPMLSLFGFDNMELRINPWSFFSFMQQMPGASAYSAQRLSELGLTDESDEQVWQSARVFSTVSEELGFGMWPWLDWAMGAQGLLGKDWYPNTAFGTWTPTVNWVVRELTDYGAGFDIDRDMRKRLPMVWNAVFGKTDLDWYQLNPDLFQEWAMGREIEGLLWKLPDLAIVALAQINPVQAKGIVRGMDEAQLDTIRAAIRPIFDMPPEQQAIVIPKLTPEEAAVFMTEVEKQSLMLTIRKAAMGNLMGNMLGLYANVTDPAEAEARQQRMQRRIEQSRIAPGAERREYMSQWYEEHPKYQMIQTWRFSEHPWAETAAGRETELWDATVDSYKDTYFEYNRNWNTKLEAAIEETYRKYPGDSARLWDVQNEFKAQKEAYIAQLNAELNAELTRRFNEYIETYPTDALGRKALTEGWDTNIYVPVQFSPSEQSQLDSYLRNYPEDSQGYAMLYERLYTEAQNRQGIAQTAHVNGLNDGISMDLQFSPVGNANYSEEEIRQFLTNDVLFELKAGAPKYDDYENFDEYDNARIAYYESLSDQAMKTETAQGQVKKLMSEQRMTQAEAEAVVKGWYTEDELRKNIHKNDTIWEALDYVYTNYYIRNAKNEFFDEIYPLKEADYDEYQFRSADLNMRYPAVEAADLVHYIMQDYSGKWTLAELDRALEGVVMPSYNDRRALEGEGVKAITNHIWAYYNMLDANQKATVREAFGDTFRDEFLAGGTSNLSVELLGNWMDELSRMTGDDLTWRELPGVDMAEMGSSVREAQSYGLPIINPRDEDEFAYAEGLNRRYWELKMAGDENWKAIAEDPVYDKWFGAGSPAGYFWYVYYKYVPPGKPGREIRNNTAISMILDKEMRSIVANNSDYDRASKLIEKWVEEQGISVEDVGVLSGEYDRVRQLIAAYTKIPKEDLEARNAFIAQNPLLMDYLEDIAPVEKATGDSGETSDGGSKGGSYWSNRGNSYSSGSRVDYKTVWTSFSARVGQSLTAALRMLSLYWAGTELPPEALAYLQKLHAELGGSLSFEVWLDALKMGYASLGRSNSSRSAGSPKAAPRPQYANVTRGIRR